MTATEDSDRSMTALERYFYLTGDDEPVADVPLADDDTGDEPGDLTDDRTDTDKEDMQ